MRAVIQRGRRLLMIHSANFGDYKFPGGGVDSGETHAKALAREVAEECGATLTRIGEAIGAVIEYDFAKEPEFDTFKMTSHYYRCEAADGFGAQRLDAYERDLGFTPIWIEIEQAIRSNQRLLLSVHVPEWLPREIFMLEYVRENFN